jgi:metallo-beta-lactamase class B
MKRVAMNVALASFLAVGSLVAAAPPEAPPASAPDAKALAKDPPLFLRLASQALRWNEPAEPTNIVGPIHFVGTKGVGVFLVTGSQGTS